MFRNHRLSKTLTVILMSLVLIFSSSVSVYAEKRNETNTNNSVSSHNTSDVFKKYATKRGFISAATNIRCGLKNNSCVQTFKDKSGSEFVIYGSQNHAYGDVKRKGAIGKYWISSGWENGKFGYPVAEEKSLGNSRWMQEFDNGFIFYERGKNVTSVEKNSAINKKYFASNKNRVFPTNNMKCGLKNSGCVQSFVDSNNNRVAVYSHNNVTQPVYLDDEVIKFWAKSGWENSKFGYPKSTKTPLSSGNGFYYRFENATIIFDGTEIIMVNNDVNIEEYLVIRQESSSLLNEYVAKIKDIIPNNVKCELIRNGCVKSYLTNDKKNRYAVYVSDNTNVVPVKLTGAIGEYWISSGWENGKYGYPVTPEKQLEGYHWVQEFENAFIYYERGKGITAVQKKHENNQEEPKDSQKQTFLENNNVVLSKTVDTVTVNDKSSLELALSGYTKLPEKIKQQLVLEKQLLDTLIEKINDLEKQAQIKQQYLDNHNNILNKTVNNVTVSDRSSVEQAINKYNTLHENVKEQLRDKKQLLDNLLSRINELETPQGILDAQTYNKFKKNAPNSEVTQYVYDGEVRTILWTRGVRPLNMQQDGSGDFKRKVTGGHYIDYHAPAVNGQGWYDVNKSKDIPVDESLCFAATAANMLHWWLKENDEYVQRYIKEQELKGVYANINEKNTSPIRDLRKLVNSYKNQQNSLLFQKFRIEFGDKVRGYYNDIVKDYFINGYPPKENGGTNDSEQPFVKDPRAGFFNEVFGGQILTDRMYAGNYDVFSRYVKNELSNGKSLAVQHTSFVQFLDHVITLWAAEFNTKGEITAIYVSDSDDQYEENEVGMKRYIVKNVNGIARTTTSIKPSVRGAEINYLYTLDLGTNTWKQYFGEK